MNNVGSSSPLTIDSFLNKGIKSINLNGFTNLELEKDTDIEKGGISSALGYGSDKVLVKKTGKEIKDKLSAASAAIVTLVTSKKSRMEEIIEKVGCLPTSAMYPYECNELPAEYKSIKRFTWEKTSYDEKSATYIAQNETGLKAESTASSKEQADLCREYNQCVDCVLEAVKDAVKADVLMRNLDDKVSYQLNVDQLTALGF